jgi:hypothetical protein
MFVYVMDIMEKGTVVAAFGQYVVMEGRILEIGVGEEGKGWVREVLIEKIGIVDAQYNGRYIGYML